jgi:hypothetical protein
MGLAYDTYLIFVFKGNRVFAASRNDPPQQWSRSLSRRSRRRGLEPKDRVTVLGTTNKSPIATTRSSSAPKPESQELSDAVAL